jgi:hypothetical protein
MNTPHARRSKTATSFKMAAKVQEIVKTDARYTIRQISCAVGISLGTVYTILKRDLKSERSVLR